MAFQPNAEALQQVLELVRGSSQARTTEEHSIINQRLDSLKTNPEFIAYLCYILCDLTTEAPQSRLMAGLVLKGNLPLYIRSQARSPVVVAFVKTQILSHMAEQNPDVRRAITSCISTIVQAEESFDMWPELLPTLIPMLETPDPNLLSAVLESIDKLFEDMNQYLYEDSAYNHLDALVPKLFAFMASENVWYQIWALSIINHCMLLQPKSLVDNIELYLRAVFSLSNSSSNEIRKRVCEGLVTLWETRCDFLMPHLKNLVTYMLSMSKDADESVAMSALEFWGALADSHAEPQLMVQAFPTLLPVMLDRMIYTEQQILDLGGADDVANEAVPDRPEDVRPRHVSVRGHGDDDDDDDDDDDASTEWNLRQCAANGLDCIAATFKDALLVPLLPLLQARLADQRWEVLESGILALGTIAEGCKDAMAQHLPQVVPHLVQLLNDQRPLIRSSACWTLSRYAPWTILPAQQATYFAPCLEALMARLLDHNKKVQTAACAAMTIFADQGRELLPGAVPKLVPVLMAAFQKYQQKNLLALYDVICTIADFSGGALSQPDQYNQILPLMMGRWNSMDNTNPDMCPLVECLSSLCLAIGTPFEPYVPGCFDRCVTLINMTLQARQQAAAANQESLVDREFMLAAMGFLAAMIEAIGANIESLIGQYQVMTIVYEGARDQDSPDVRQMAFVLLGDITEQCPGHVQPVLKEMLPLLQMNIHPAYVLVCNNAAWAIGEIAIKFPTELRPHVPSIFELYVPIINRNTQPSGHVIDGSSMSDSLVQNVASSMGRVAISCADILAPRLNLFVAQWCLALRKLMDHPEKEQAYLGLIATIRQNPNAALEHFVHVCDALVAWKQTPDSIQQQAATLFSQFRQHFSAEQWAEYFGKFPPVLQQKLVANGWI